MEKQPTQVFRLWKTSDTYLLESYEQTGRIRNSVKLQALDFNLAEETLARVRGLNVPILDQFGSTMDGEMAELRVFGGSFTIVCSWIHPSALEPLNVVVDWIRSITREN